MSGETAITDSQPIYSAGVNRSVSQPAAKQEYRKKPKKADVINSTPYYNTADGVKSDHC